MSLVGKTIDERYEVRGILGEGGMGLVYEGRHIGLGRKVAIKVLHAEFQDEDHASQRFMQEAQIAGSLGHPNICDVTDIGVTEDDLPYMVMPLLEGQTLAEAMEACDEGFPAARAVDIVSQVLSALQPAHEAGIVHRDLKPENIFLTRAGDRQDFVKVLDFGISKIVGGSSSSLKQLTSTGMVVGTPYYMAPEQASGEKDLDPRVDIYAVGALLYELLTGRTPHLADNYNEIIVKIVNQTPPRPREVQPDLPASLEAVVWKALSKDREARYASVSEFRQALQDAGTGVSTTAKLQRATGEGAADEEGEPNTLSTAAAEVKDITPTVSLQGTAARPQAIRWGWILSGAGVVVIAVLVVFLVRARGPATADRPVAPPAPRALPAAMARDATAAAKPATATIRFLGLPKGAKVLLGGVPVRGGQATVTRSPYKLRYRVEAPGHEPFEGEVTPNEDRTLPITLAPARPVPDAGVPDATAPAVMRPWGVIRGRGGTSVKTNYDED